MNITSKLTFVFVGLIALPMLIQGEEHAAVSVSADAALGKLKEGNTRFTTNAVSEGKPNGAKRAETANGQHPFAIVLACADSRTSPEIIFDQNIGDIFVVRTAGNLVDNHMLGSIEYAIEHLGTRLVVVLGHSKCGAVAAAVAGDKAPGHVQSLVTDIQPAVQSVKGKSGDATELAVTENARIMADKVRTQIEIGDLTKEVRIVPAVYNIETGKIEWGKE